MAVHTRQALFRALAAAVFAAAGHAQTAAGSAANGAIGCLGRIEPEDGVIQVAAPYVDGAPAVVEELKVQENARVSKGQVLAVMHGAAAVEASVREATARVGAARKRLAQAKEPPKQADIAARQAEIRRLELELLHAREELVRYETLRKTDDVSASEAETRRTAALTAERSLEETRQKLRGMQEISPGAVEVAEAELNVAIATEQRIAASRANMVVRAPAAGAVLRIHAREGEQIGPEGLLELAKTARMYVIAEVYETDIRRVHAGQSAVISGEVLSGPLSGKVERVGAVISKSRILPTDPATFSDTRVVPVYIRLNDAAAAANLIHGKVSVVIQP